MKAFQGFIEGRHPLGPGLLLHLRCPSLEPPCSAGQFFLVRCTPSPDIWDPYPRRALFPALIEPERLTLWLADANDRGLAWLVTQPEGTRLDLLGPGGRGFELPPSRARVLILAQDEGLGPVWPLLRRALTEGHQVTLALGVRRGDLAVSPEWVPVAVEYRLATKDGRAGREGDVFDLLSGLEEWPDRIYAALPRAQWSRLRAWIESWRPMIEPGFAQVLVLGDILCGIGACLTCIIERRDGRLTRTCVHGPVMDLTTLA